MIEPLRESRLLQCRPLAFWPVIVGSSGCLRRVCERVHTLLPVTKKAVRVLRTLDPVVSRRAHHPGGDLSEVGPDNRQDHPELRHADRCTIRRRGRRRARAASLSDCSRRGEGRASLDHDQPAGHRRFGTALLTDIATASVPRPAAQADERDAEHARRRIQAPRAEARAA